MLNCLDTWCNSWKMTVNADKSKVVHFRPGPATPRTVFEFTCGDKQIAVVSQYRYLGLVLTEFLDYSVTAKFVAQAATRALGLLIAKSKAHGGMPYNCFSKLYDALVQSIFSYGAAIWGDREFSSVNAVQNRACRFFLGVGKYTPNSAVQGDMGWALSIHKQWLCVTRLWCRLVNMNNDRLNKKIFIWGQRLSSTRIKNLMFRVSNFYRLTQCMYLLDLNSVFNIKSTIKAVDSVLFAYYEQIWFDNINRVQALRGTGRNKLRTYKLFKTEMKPDKYVMDILPRNHRSAMAKFRCGVAPIRLETGRYENIEENDRVCFNCNQVENEMHVILHCPVYNDLRDVLFQHVNNVLQIFNQSNDTEKLNVILSHPELVRPAAKFCDQVLSRRKFLLYDVPL